MIGAVVFENLVMKYGKPLKARLCARIVGKRRGLRHVKAARHAVTTLGSLLHFSALRYLFLRQKSRNQFSTFSMCRRLVSVIRVVIRVRFIDGGSSLNEPRLERHLYCKPAKSQGSDDNSS